MLSFIPGKRSISVQRLVDFHCIVGKINLEEGPLKGTFAPTGVILTSEELRQVLGKIDEICGIDPLDLAAQTIHCLNFLGCKNVGIPDIVRIICGVCRVDRAEAEERWESAIKEKVVNLQNNEMRRHEDAVRLWRSLPDVPDSVRNHVTAEHAPVEATPAESRTALSAV